MKLTLLLSLLSILVGYATCRKLQGTPETTAAPETPAQQERTGMGGLTVSHVHAGSNADSAGTVQVVAPPRMVTVPLGQLPPASASRRAYLATGWWHLNMAFQASDTTIHRQYQHKWLKFREDQTFDVLVKNAVVDTGRWNWDEKTNTVYIDCRDPYVNNTWRVTDKGFVMIWVGNTDLNITGIQIRVIGSKTPPPAN